MTNLHSTTVATKIQNQTRKNPAELLAPGWVPHLGAEFNKPYMDTLRNFLKSEVQKRHTFFPAANKIFRALKLVDYNEVRVLILGQDPYHGEGQANGLAFAVEKDVPPPPSLQNIFKEIASSYPIPKGFKFDKTLEGWAKQGVLCLNTVLTVRKNSAFSHREKGWELFTDKVLECLMQKETPLVFLCWGSPAAQKISKIHQLTQAKEDDKKLHTSSTQHTCQKFPHLILRAPHPSPLSAHRGFLGCGHFTKTNEFLKKCDLKPINWLA